MQFVPRLDLLARSRMLSTSTATNNDLPTESATSATARRRQPRNQDLENIVRQGISYLNQSALAIKNDVRSQKNLFSNEQDDDGPTARQRYEEHRILRVAQECLERLHAKDPMHPLMCATGEPITLLRVSVNVTNTHADLYWSLPYSVLSQIPDPRHRMVVQNAMEKRVSEDRELLRRMHGILMKEAFSPRVRMKIADLAEVQAMMEEMA